MATEPVVTVNTRERLVNWLIAIAAAIAAAIGARYGIEIPPPPPVVIPDQPTRPPAPDTPPTEPTPDPLGAIVRISSGNVGCSATVIGPRRPDGRYWVLSAAHCVNGAGQRWTMRFRDGRQTGAVVVNFNRAADWAWLVTDANNLILDLHAGPIQNPEALDRELRALPGIVETGLFIARADLVLVAGSGGVQRLQRAS